MPTIGAAISCYIGGPETEIFGSLQLNGSGICIEYPLQNPVIHHNGGHHAIAHQSVVGIRAVIPCILAGLAAEFLFGAADQIFSAPQAFCMPFLFFIKYVHGAKVHHLRITSKRSKKTIENIFVF